MFAVSLTFWKTSPDHRVVSNHLLGGGGGESCLQLQKTKMTPTGHADVEDESQIIMNASTDILTYTCRASLLSSSSSLHPRQQRGGRKPLGRG